MSLLCKRSLNYFFLPLMIVVLYDFCADRKYCINSIQKLFYCMFEKLRKKWKVNALQLTLILCVFAIGGSLTGFAGKKIMNLLSIEADWLWAIVYIILITVIWPMMVLIVSFPFGQFRFFTNYTRKLGQKLGLIRSRESGVRSQESEISS